MITRIGKFAIDNFEVHQTTGNLLILERNINTPYKTHKINWMFDKRYNDNPTSPVHWYVHSGSCEIDNNKIVDKLITNYITNLYSH